LVSTLQPRHKVLRQAIYCASARVAVIVQMLARAVSSTRRLVALSTVFMWSQKTALPEIPPDDEDCTVRMRLFRFVRNCGAGTGQKSIAARGGGDLLRNTCLIRTCSSPQSHGRSNSGTPFGPVSRSALLFMLSQPRFWSSDDFGPAPVSDQLTFWLQPVAYLIVAIFSLMQGYDAYADREWRTVAASAAVFALMCFVIWMLVVH
jgi:hypothetical protein